MIAWLLLLILAIMNWRELLPVWRWVRGEGRLVGIYRHKKGGLYLALGIVQDSERQMKREGAWLAPERLVLYVGRSGWWVRPEWMFCDGRFCRVL